MKLKDPMVRLERPIALCLAMLLAVPFGMASTTPVSSAPATAGTQPTADARGSEEKASVAEYPDSPGASWALSQQQSTPPQPQSAPAQPQSAPAQPQPNAPQQTPADQQNTAPVGTAVAPYVKADGATAARPTGAAIAPGKQKRSHSLALKLGLIVGGAIAIGTVAGLSLGSSSKPH